MHDESRRKKNPSESRRKFGPLHRRTKELRDRLDRGPLPPFHRPRCSGHAHISASSGRCWSTRAAKAGSSSTARCQLAWPRAQRRLAQHENVSKVSNFALDSEFRNLVTSSSNRVFHYWVICHSPRLQCPSHAPRENSAACLGAGEVPAVLQRDAEVEVVRGVALVQHDRGAVPPLRRLPLPAGSRDPSEEDVGGYGWSLMACRDRAGPPLRLLPGSFGSSMSGEVCTVRHGSFGTPESA